MSRDEEILRYMYDPLNIKKRRAFIKIHYFLDETLKKHDIFSEDYLEIILN